MALPTTVDSTVIKFPLQNYYTPPFSSSGGNVYVVVLDTTNSKLHVYKATDPTVSFTVQDDANIPTQAPIESVWVRADGDVLSIAGAAFAALTLSFHQFNMATDTWSSTIKDKSIGTPPSVAFGRLSISVVKRSDASFIAFFNGPTETIHSASYSRVYYTSSTDGGST